VNITFFLSWGIKTNDVAVLGVYIHSRAGELAATKKTSQSMIASDIPMHLSALFLQEFT
jgi:NAD(P)H-hydrate repair Nnr-like enzyme with NAD(P)H-hydrate dehydratase domain